MPPVSDSSTGGYLLPSGTPPLAGRELAQFIHGWVVGVSGLPGPMVRVAFQPEPPNVPQAGQSWCAVQIKSSSGEEFPFVGRLPGVTGDALQSNDTVDLLISFYDLGQTGLADLHARRFRDGAVLAQNREPLQLAGFGLVKRPGPLVAVPSLLSRRWLYRVDVETMLRYQYVQTYRVLDVDSARGDLYTDGGLPPQPFAAS